MRYDALTARHPCCDLGAFRRFDALYKGGLAFRQIIGEFLHQNPMEPREVYTHRLREASYRSYVGTIVDGFAAQLFSSPFIVRSTRDGEVEAADPFYSAFKEDVDLAGTDLVSFMKTRFITSMVKGVSWWVAEQPEEGSAPAESRLDWEERGLGRVRLIPLEPDEVLNWEVDEYGALLWAITLKREMRQDDPRVPRKLITETWKVYDAQTVETFQSVHEANKTPKPEQEIPSLGRFPHRFPRVPLIQMRLPDAHFAHREHPSRVIVSARSAPS